MNGFIIKKYAVFMQLMAFRKRLNIKRNKGEICDEKDDKNSDRGYGTDVFLYA